VSDDSTVTTPVWTAPPRRDWKRIAIIGVVLLIAINLAVIGIHATVTDTGSGEALPESILSTIPPCGEIVLAQSAIGAQIATGYSAELSLDNVPLPADEYDKLQLVNNIVLWRPGPGQTFRQMSPGDHIMVISYTPTVQSARLPAGTYSCQFKVT